MVLFFSWVIPEKRQNGFLLFISLLFYAWGGVSYTIVLLGSIILNYFVGLQISTHSSPKSFLVLGIAINISMLVVFKYADFSIYNINHLLSALAIAPLPLPKILLPLGISFYTFQAISYLFDVYRKVVPAQKSIIKLGLYIALFPQLIAGPIVRYHDINQQIEKRVRGWNLTTEGLIIFIIGLSKKVILADNFGRLADDIFQQDFSLMEAGTAWVGILAYSLQIFFDFSGYSEMAIGLGKLFGFELPVNFNYPYLARSVQEFWRRWHITLSTWFRDYLYIPLGGSRQSKVLTYRNLIIVFLVTGLWHGASWSFLLWGLWHGFFLILERQKYFPIKHHNKWGHLYLLLVVVLGWVLFRAENINAALDYYSALFFFNAAVTHFDFSQFQHLEFYTIVCFGLFISSPYPYRLHLSLQDWANKRTLTAEGYGIVQFLLLGFLFLYCNMLLINDSFHPFIYFRF